MFFKLRIYFIIIIFLVNTKTLNKDDVSACVPHLFAALEDRTPEVRKAAQDATLAFMIHLGYDNLARNAAKLKPASKNIVQAHIDKVRPNLPAKPAPTAAPSTAVRGKAPVSPSKESPKESDDGGKAPHGKVVRAPSKTKVKVSIFLAHLQSHFT